MSKSRKGGAAAQGSRRNDMVTNYVRASLVMIGSFAGLAVVLAIIT